MEDNKKTLGGGGKSKLYTLIVIVLLVLIGISGYCGYRFIKHESNQKSQIQSLQANVSKLQTEIDILKNSLDDTSIEWEENSYKYLAIGNSITRHPINEYWWNEIGMAASTIDNDYVHILANSISELVGDVDVKVTNLSSFEVQYNDRAETLALLNPYLDSELDLVTIQLGENVTNTDTLERDFEELIRYIKDKCPKARILVLGQYWKDDTKDSIKKEASLNTNVEFVDLSSMFEKEASLYNAGMGTIVYDEDGNSHIIEHEGVAAHPGDEGMKEIARLVFEVYKSNN